ncbi:hypothetical protein N1027_17995 [Herbiconiux sp. CPCC 205763]|uniref:Restriction endonuclease n=1 Tax=Herbiconiux aconitum TaxID=2970913 RepID=A0ABT2GUZ5_9MICO|nr:hypothetical protein [Herbiconiux aconitum]MCS5720027.1 hypothetical protein [Herbiconiux aconitum]
METPNWTDPKSGGTMARSALWLLQEVGIGETFTKANLRDSFPGVAQIDRRMRDLRKYGWAIDTSANDASLAPDEQRFVRQGEPVWESTWHAPAVSNQPTSRQRSAAFEADDYVCVVCGIAGGETYPDIPSKTAVLTATPVNTIVGARSSVEFVTNCGVCRSGTPSQGFELDELRAELRRLDPAELSKLKRWIAKSRRIPTPADRLWMQLRRLPAPVREELSKYLD